VQNRSVSQRNVEIVRESFEAFGRGEFDAAFAAYDPAVEWQTADDEPDSHVYCGIPELRGFVAHLADPWTDRFGPAIHFEDFIDCGDWVVTPWSGRLHGHGSGIEIDVSETYAVLVRDGRITRVEEYRTVEQALEAVGGPPSRNDPAGRAEPFLREE
jgi:ketosteroid isomerase-like protein